ncbi:hypothetical protein B0H11DRAFT_1943113 [Mycena galericulata]|nr:hypothetical protein B0H11DRAFT_1943113 [Mycena galericulata]
MATKRDNDLTQGNAQEIKKIINLKEKYVDSARDEMETPRKLQGIACIPSVDITKEGLKNVQHRAESAKKKKVQCTPCATKCFLQEGFIGLNVEGRRIQNAAALAQDAFDDGDKREDYRKYTKGFARLLENVSTSVGGTSMKGVHDSEESRAAEGVIQERASSSSGGHPRGAWRSNHEGCPRRQEPRAASHRCESFSGKVVRRESGTRTLSMDFPLPTSRGCCAQPNGCRTPTDLAEGSATFNYHYVDPQRAPISSSKDQLKESSAEQTLCYFPSRARETQFYMGLQREFPESLRRTKLMILLPISRDGNTVLHGITARTFNLIGKSTTSPMQVASDSECAGDLEATECKVTQPSKVFFHWPQPASGSLNAHHLIPSSSVRKWRRYVPLSHSRVLSLPPTSPYLLPLPTPPSLRAQVRSPTASRSTSSIPRSESEREQQKARDRMKHLRAERLRRRQSSENDFALEHENPELYRAQLARFMEKGGPPFDPDDAIFILKHAAENPPGPHPSEEEVERRLRELNQCILVLNIAPDDTEEEAAWQRISHEGDVSDDDLEFMFRRAIPEPTLEGMEACACR